MTVKRRAELVARARAAIMNLDEARWQEVEAAVLQALAATDSEADTAGYRRGFKDGHAAGRGAARDPERITATFPAHDFYAEAQPDGHP
jgi:hypothetical protein